jgi:hypothetical protein
MVKSSFRGLGRPKYPWLVKSLQTKQKVYENWENQQRKLSTWEARSTAISIAVRKHLPPCIFPQQHALILTHENSISIQLLRTDLPPAATRAPRAIQRRSRIPPDLPRRHQRRLGQQTAMDPPRQSKIRRLRLQTRDQMVRNQTLEIRALLPNFERFRESLLRLPSYFSREYISPLSEPL